jgi:hypothetical protein
VEGEWLRVGDLLEVSDSSALHGMERGWFAFLY